MARGDGIRDLIRLILWMEDSYQGVSIQDIQDEFDVSRSTAIRMKRVVDELFAVEEVENYSSPSKKWRLCKKRFTDMIKFTAEELAELENCKSMMRNLNYTNRCDLLSEIMAKMNALNEQKSIKTDVEALLEAEGYAVRQFPRYKMNMSTFNIISEALKALKYVTFSYENKKGEKSDLKIQPYGIIYGEKTYLLGYNGDKKGFRTYNINEIKNPKILDEYFDRDEKFNLKQYLSRSFGVYQEEPMKVKLLFSKDVKDAISNYNLHPTQKQKVNPDGTTTVTFEAGGRYEICWHLFRWGKSVKILEPQELKDTYKKLLDEATGQI
ncbi:WYL domain-containing protein [bacterium]|nr:WYL domain-containing protein [bacterium]